jgi:hypothetical protein
MADRTFVQTSILECLVLYLVTRFRPATLHASAVVWKGMCVLLAGPGRSGKSTLAYACARAGMQVVSDDCVRVDSSGSRVRVWGNPWFMHLRPDSGRFFPELHGFEPTPQLSGELKIQIDTECIWSGCCLPLAQVNSALVLERSRCSHSRVEYADVREVAEALMPPGAPFPADLVAVERGAELAASCRPGRLILGADIHEAVAVIREWLEAEGEA